MGYYGVPIARFLEEICYSHLIAAFTGSGSEYGPEGL